MYLHIGQDIVLRRDEIIGVFDMDKATVQQKTRLFLSEQQKNGKITYVGDDLPQSFIVTDRGIYVTVISAATLKKRLGKIFEQEEQNGTATRL